MKFFLNLSLHGHQIRFPKLLFLRTHSLERSFLEIILNLTSRYTKKSTSFWMESKIFRIVFLVFNYEFFHRQLTHNRIINEKRSLRHHTVHSMSFFFSISFFPNYVIQAMWYIRFWSWLAPNFIVQFN